jgi:hypothetical protein
MRWRSTRSIRSLISAFVVLLTQMSVIDAAEPDICAVSANASRFDHQRVTLGGIVAGLMKTTSRSGSKYMRFLLRSSAGCGGVIVFTQELATLSNGDHLQVEGIFETQYRREGFTFHDVIEATKVIALPR